MRIDLDRSEGDGTVGSSREATEKGRALAEARVGRRTLSTQRTFALLQYAHVRPIFRSMLAAADCVAGVSASASSNRELLSALSAAMGVLASEGNDTTALMQSFEHAARGFGAQEALLLRVRADPLTLESIHHIGKLSSDQIRACIHGESVPGVSPSVIRRAITTGEPQLIENSLDSQKADLTVSLSSAAHSVLAAPVSDPWTRTVLAVLYFQTLAHTRTYSRDDLPTLEAYATTLSQAFGLFFSTQRRYQELHENWQRLKSNGVPDIVGESEEIARLKTKLHETYIPATENSRTDPILILGPTGSGKDLVARYIHYYSPSRNARRFVSFNCAALRGDLCEKTLFGHCKGAFTGALRDELGLFREAEGGTLFLDELGELPPEGQSLLLRVLDQRTVRPVGGHSETPVNVQLLVATNRDLGSAVASGQFRLDLYHRLKNLTIRLSPLAARPGDIRPLVTYFFDHHQRRLHKRTRGLSRESLVALLSYAWPGNVRELDGVCSALITHAKPGQLIDLQHVRECCPDVLDGEKHPPSGALAEIEGSIHEARSAFERAFVLRRLDLYHWNVPDAAKSMGLHVATLYRYLHRHGLRPSVEEAP